MRKIELKVGDGVHCYADGFFTDGEQFCTKGRCYPVFRKEDSEFWIIDDIGMVHSCSSMNAHKWFALNKRVILLEKVL